MIDLKKYPLLYDRGLWHIYKTTKDGVYVVSRCRNCGVAMVEFVADDSDGWPANERCGVCR